MTRPSTLAASVASFIMLSGFAASADEGDRAEQLFQEARVLVEARRIAEACPKLEESWRLDPAVGTQFNLADCYERLGKTASAFRLFRDVAGIARAAGKFERERSAKERMAALAPRLARVRVSFGVKAPGLTVALDGKASLELDGGSEAVPVDPGRHTLSATAPGHVPFETTFDAQEGATATIEVPALVSSAPAVAPATRTPASKKVAIGVGAASAVAVAVGGVAGVLALEGRAEARRLCPEDPFAFRCPTVAGSDAWNEARSAGTISTVGFVAGGALLAGAAMLWLLAPSPRARAGVTASGLRLEGQF